MYSLLLLLRYYNKILQLNRKNVTKGYSEIQVKVREGKEFIKLNKKNSGYNFH